MKDRPLNPGAPADLGGPSRKIAGSLVALSSAAVLTIYAAGYLRTRAAAARVEGQAAGREAAVPFEATDGAPTAAPQPRVVPALSPQEGASHSRSGGTSLAPAPSASTDSSNQPPSPPVAQESVAADPAAQVEISPKTPTAQGVDQPSAESPDAPATTLRAKYKDGTYLGWGTSRHGDIQASVVIEDGRIVSATIAQCLTRYSCSWIEHLPPQVVARQSPEVDFVSGATQSTNAFYYAVVEALSKAL